MRILFFHISIFFVLFFFSNNLHASSKQDSINDLLIKKIELGFFDDATDLVINHNANVNHVDTVVYTTGGSSGGGGMKPIRGGGIIGGLLNAVLAPVMVITNVIDGIASALSNGNRGVHYDFITVLEKAIGAPNRYGKYEFIELLLQQGADPNVSGKNFYYPLNHAIKKGDSKIVDLLIDYGADVPLASKRESLLMQAIELKNNEMAIAFLKKGDDPLKLETFNDNALNKAISYQMLDFVEECARGNISFNKQPNADESPYYLALLTRNNRIIEIVEERATISESDLYNNIGSSVVYRLAEQGEKNNKRIKELTERFPKTINSKDYHGSSILNVFIEREDEEMLNYFIGKGIIIDSETKISGLTSVNRNIIEAFVENEEDAMYLYNFDLKESIIKGDVRLAREMLDKGAKFEQEDFGNAIKNKNTEVVSLLIEHGADVNKEIITVDKYDRETSSYPLSKALYYSNKTNMDMIHLLLQNGAEFTNRDFVDNVFSRDNFQVCKTMIDYGYTKEKYNAISGYKNYRVTGKSEDYFQYLSGYDPIYPMFNEKKEIEFYTVEKKQLACEEIFINAYPFEKEVARVQTSMGWAIVNRNGRIISDYYDEIQSFHFKISNEEGILHELVLVKDAGKFGYINKQGEEIFPVMFEQAVSLENTFSQGRSFAKIKYNGLYGVIADDGSFVLPPKFPYIEAIYGKGANVTTPKGKEKYISYKSVTLEKVLKKYGE